jgi:hypothetical protein
MGLSSSRLVVVSSVFDAFQVFWGCDCNKFFQKSIPFLLLHLSHSFNDFLRFDFYFYRINNVLAFLFGGLVHPHFGLFGLPDLFAHTLCSFAGV